ncbi:MAG: hypothetical protein KBT68_00345 [bacterium]|nr:hypothetical protein [Candidatus Colisoma equi]
MADVSSANVVGYSTVTVKAGWLNLISAQFDAVGENARPALNDGFVSGEIFGTDQYSYDDADMIMVYMPSLGGYHSDYKFYWSVDESDPSYNNVWLCTTDDEPTDYVLPADKSFFYWCRNDHDVTLTFAGAVKAEPVSAEITGNYLNMVANPYPAEIVLNGANRSFAWETLGVKGSDQYSYDEADMIMLYVPTLGGYHSDYKFYWSIDESDSAYNNVWLCTTDDEPTTQTIPAGAGFWYWRRGAENITLPFASPIADK